ncbi:MAG TPA: HRDC domain-containing protein [Gemmatimonadaceae bacterium]|nr:HRDC domain-containing protein [Gemmatimonadaceae bacterium]
MRAANSEAALYLDKAADVERFLNEISHVKELALDTEGASFHRFLDRIYLLQISTRDRNAIIDPLPIGSPAALGELLQHNDIEVVFHDADYDLRLLHQDYGWHVTNIFDTRIAAQLLGIKSFGLAALLEQFFDVKLDKKHQRADWSMRPLPQDMLDYAVQDTRYLLQLRDHMKSELQRRGRWHWAQEEFARLEGTRWETEEAMEGFLRLKGARDLTRRELAVLREVSNWRDKMAEQLDRATFRVMGNEVLFELARTAPRNVTALSTIKGMPKGMIDRAGSDLVSAIRRGLEAPEAELPRFPRGQRWNKDRDFDDRVGRLKSVRDAAATRLELDPGVLCSRERLENVARSAAKTVNDLEKVPDLRKWQIQEMGEQFLQALRAPNAA